MVEAAAYSNPTPKISEEVKWKVNELRKSEGKVSTGDRIDRF